MDDLIKRSDAIKYLKRWFHNKGWMVSDEDCKSILWDIPSADRLKGKWIPWRYHNGFRCNQCGEPVYDKHNFCPNCGADMREADDDL